MSSWNSNKLKFSPQQDATHIAAVAIVILHNTKACFTLTIQFTATVRMQQTVNRNDSSQRRERFCIRRQHSCNHVRQHVTLCREYMCQTETALSHVARTEVKP